MPAIWFGEEVGRPKSEVGRQKLENCQVDKDLRKNGIFTLNNKDNNYNKDYLANDSEL